MTKRHTMKISPPLISERRIELSTSRYPNDESNHIYNHGIHGHSTRHGLRPPTRATAVHLLASRVSVPTVCFGVLRLSPTPVFLQISSQRIHRPSQITLTSLSRSSSCPFHHPNPSFSLNSCVVRLCKLVEFRGDGSFRSNHGHAMGFTRHRSSGGAVQSCLLWRERRLCFRRR